MLALGQHFGLEMNARCRSLEVTNWMLCDVKTIVFMQHCSSGTMVETLLRGGSGYNGLEQNFVFWVLEGV